MRFSPTRLRAIREAAGLSREQVARRVGKASGTICAYERGRVTPTITALADLAELYGVPLDSLFDAGDPSDPVTVCAEEIRQLVASWPPLTADQKRELRALLRGVA